MGTLNITFQSQSDILCFRCHLFDHSFIKILHGRDMFQINGLTSSSQILQVWFIYLKNHTVDQGAFCRGNAIPPSDRDVYDCCDIIRFHLDRISIIRVLKIHIKRIQIDFRSIGDTDHFPTHFLGKRHIFTFRIDDVYLIIRIQDNIDDLPFGCE